MADQTTAPATAATISEATPTATTAAAAADPGEGTLPAGGASSDAKPAPTLAELKAARRDKAAPAPKATVPPASGSGGSTSSSSTPAAPATSGTPAPAAQGDKPPATAQIDMSDDALKSFTNLQRELREARTKLKNTEDRIASFGKFEKAQTLAKEGKHYDAAREAGIDVDAALAELLGQNGGQSPTAGQIDKKLADEIADLVKFKDDTLKEREASKAAEVEAVVKRDREVTGRFVTDNAVKYPFLAKSPDLVDGVFSDYTKAKAKLEAEGEALSDKEQVKLMLDSLAVHEEKWAKVFGTPATTEAKTEGEQPAGPDGSARAGVRQPPPAEKKKLTFDELKAERAARRIAARTA